MKQRIIIYLLILILCFLFYKFYPERHNVEKMTTAPLQFLVETVTLVDGQTVTPDIEPNTLIQLTNNVSNSLITIPTANNTNQTTGTLHGIIDCNGNTKFSTKNGYSVWISPIDMTNKVVTNSSTELELICFKDDVDYKQSTMTSIGTIRVSTPLMYQTLKMNFPSGQSEPPIEMNTIFYLKPDLYDVNKMYNIYGISYDNVTILRRDYNGRLLNADTNNLWIKYEDKKRHRSYNRERHRNRIINDTYHGSLFVTSIFDMSNLIEPPKPTMPVPVPTMPVPVPTMPVPVPTMPVPVPTTPVPVPTTPVPVPTMPVPVPITPVPLPSTKTAAQEEMNFSFANNIWNIFQ